MKRVVVTGLGAVTPVGLDAPSTWAAMLEGQSGVGKVTLFDASETIRRGDAAAVVSGGSEAVLLPIVYAGFCAMRALAQHEDPAQASRPFDRDRNGFVISEGAGALILEELDHARRRDARIYAEVIGYGSSNDAFDMAAPAEGEGAFLTMQRALRKAEIEPERVDYINAHGTGTPLNDKFETDAIHRVFGEHAERIIVSSTKSMTGHMMGASGAVEAVVCA